MMQQTHFAPFLFLALASGTSEAQTRPHGKETYVPPAKTSTFDPGPIGLPPLYRADFLSASTTIPPEILKQLGPELPPPELPPGWTPQMLASRNSVSPTSKAALTTEEKLDRELNQKIRGEFSSSILETWRLYRKASETPRQVVTETVLQAEEKVANFRLYELGYRAVSQQTKDRLAGPAARAWLASLVENVEGMEKALKTFLPRGALPRTLELAHGEIIKAAEAHQKKGDPRAIARSLKLANECLGHYKEAISEFPALKESLTAACKADRTFLEILAPHWWPNVDAAIVLKANAARKR